MKLRDFVTAFVSGDIVSWFIVTQDNHLSPFEESCTLSEILHFDVKPEWLDHTVMYVFPHLDHEKRPFQERYEAKIKLVID